MGFKSVCWDITPKCNEQCLFCYRDMYSEEASLEKNKEILKRLISNCVGKISFVGGEPLLYEHLFELVEYGKSLDNHVQYSLTTNAILLTNFDEKGNCNIDIDLLSKIADLFDWISFSMDAATDSLQLMMGRNSKHITRIVTLLDYIRKKNFDIKIKVNTVVSKINLNVLAEMIPILEQYKVDRWKLFKFLPSRGAALINKQTFDISSYEYQNCVEELTNRSCLNITYNDDSDFQNTYPAGRAASLPGPSLFCEG